MVWLGINTSQLIRLIVYHGLPHHVVDDQVLFNRQDIERWAMDHKKLFLLKMTQHPKLDPPKPKK